MPSMSTMPEYHNARVSIAHWKAKTRQATSEERMQKCIAKLGKWEGILANLQQYRHRAKARVPKPPKPAKVVVPKPPKPVKVAPTRVDRPQPVVLPVAPPAKWVPTPLCWD